MKTDPNLSLVSRKAREILVAGRNCGCQKPFHNVVLSGDREELCPIRIDPGLNAVPASNAIHLSNLDLHVLRPNLIFESVDIPLFVRHLHSR